MDSRKPFNLVTKEGSTAELCLEINVYALEKSYNKREFWDVAWIPGEENVGDELLKEIISKEMAM